MIFAVAAAAATAVIACYLIRKRGDHIDLDNSGSCSRSSTSGSDLATAMTEEEDGTTTLVTQSNVVLQAENITLSKLQELLKGKAGYKTTMAVVEELHRLKTGGALVVVYDCKGGADKQATMPLKSLGQGKLRDTMRLYAKKLFVDDSEGASVNPNFRAIVRGFSRVPHDGACADKWTKPVLEDMARSLGQSWETVDESLRLLVGQPADGALAVLSLKGTVVGASSRIDIKSDVELIWPNGEGTGCKHKAAVSAVEWCRLKHLQGAAIVRSDSGRVTMVGIIDSRTRAFQISGF